MIDTVIRSLPALGGVGLFLLGMSLLTDSLRALSASKLRHLMARFTNSPLSGAATGAIFTAIIQSSSATTVAAVSFVGAGILTFAQALGVIFGANIGTTITGWIVALIGFKLQLGQALLPFVFVAALLKLLGTPRLKLVGTALAGFALLFIGIDAMQSGLATFEGFITPDDFPADTFLGRLSMIGIGMGITIVTQSSSAGVATAMVALGAGTISFPQAAALVIGMDVGTTFTAALATLGGSTNMRRTGFAHVIYNVMTGILAFMLLPLYLYLAEPWLARIGPENAQSALVAFHTIFNIIGVILILGFTKPFARMLIALVPERGPVLTRRLDERLLPDSEAASAASFATAQIIARHVAGILALQLADRSGGSQYSGSLTAAEEATAELSLYLAKIQISEVEAQTRQQHVSVLHAVDHIERLINRCRQFRRIDVLDEDDTLRDLAQELSSLTQEFGHPENIAAPLTEKLDKLRRVFRTNRKTYRKTTLLEVSAGLMQSDGASDRLDAMRWLHRTTYHLWRLATHFQTSEQRPEIAPVSGSTAMARQI